MNGDENMEITLQKWGNSNGIRIPSSILKSLNLKTNDKMKIEQVDDKIIISKNKDNKVSLAQKFKDYKGKNLAKEFVWDEARGKEIW